MGENVEMRRATFPTCGDELSGEERRGPEEEEGRGKGIIYVKKVMYKREREEEEEGEGPVLQGRKECLGRKRERGLGGDGTRLVGKEGRGVSEVVGIKKTGGD